MDAFRLLVRGVRARLCVERGAVAAEYSLILALIALAIIVAATAFGISVTGLFDQGVERFPPT